MKVLRSALLNDIGRSFPLHRVVCEEWRHPRYHHQYKSIHTYLVICSDPLTTLPADDFSGGELPVELVDTSLCCSNVQKHNLNKALSANKA